MPAPIVLFDVDTQFDFLLPAGSLYVPGAEDLLPNLTALTRFAAVNKYPLVSTVDAHLENDVEFRVWPAHCVSGTFGQLKSCVTRLAPAVTIANEPGAFDKAAPQLASAAQFVIEKQTLDAFTNPNLQPLLEHLGADCYVVYGVVTELCVEKALAGLVKLQKRVVLVTDAIRELNRDASEKVIGQYHQAGIELRTTGEIVSGSF
jgi:nicotinamidase/pyrazinamidase